MSTEQTIYTTAVADGMPASLAQIIVDQSKGESGNYTSRFFTVGKNAFGYSYNKSSKWQLPTGGPNADNGIPIAQYASVQNSVHELTDWIKRRQSEGKFPKDLNTITSIPQYTALLKAAGYYGASESAYTALLTRFSSDISYLKDLIVKNKKPILLALAGAAILSAGVLIYIKARRTNA